MGFFERFRSTGRAEEKNAAEQKLREAIAGRDAAQKSFDETLGRLENLDELRAQEAKKVEEEVAARRAKVENSQ